MSWQPIETAPRDGTVILIAKAGKVYASFYDPNDGAFAWAFLSGPLQNGQLDGWRDDPKWGPSHWMPLPSAPQHSGEPRG